MTKVSTNWKTVSTKTLFKNKFFELREDTVTLPNGKTTEYYYRYREPFSVVIPIVGDKTYLVQQYRYNVKSLSWEFPMGFVEGKNPYDSAVTELKEETGMTAGKFEEIGKFWIGVGSSNQSGYVYVATELTQGIAEPEEGEFFELKEFSIEEVRDMIDKGEILDGPTITSFHYLESYLKNK